MIPVVAVLYYPCFWLTVVVREVALLRHALHVAHNDLVAKQEAAQ